MANIEKGKPLPDHTKLRYEECYAKLLLEHCIPKFKNGLVLRDKPDLYCPHCDTGIEVTDIMSKEKREAVKLWYMMPYVSPLQQKKSIERMRQLGVEYSGGVQTWPTIVYDKELDSKPYVELYDAIKKKLEKLNNGNLDLFGQNELILMTEIVFYGYESHLIVEKLIQAQNGFSLKFNSLYIVTIDQLFQYDLEQSQIKEYYFDQYAIARLARDLVERGEEDEQA